MKPPYYTIEQMLEFIIEPNRSKCKKLLMENRQLFEKAPGSFHNHQAWPGGYLHHVQEVMNIAIILYEQLRALRPLSFMLSDLLLVLFLHDLEKPWKYDRSKRGIDYPRFEEKSDRHRFRIDKINQYGIELTDIQENAIHYAEGELDDYMSTKRMMGQLAAVAHMCDVASARLWFNRPGETSDHWTGAKRIRE